MNQGLARVSSDGLRLLLALLDQGRIPCPLNLADIRDAGFGDRAEDIVRALGNLDASAARVAIEVVLAEREHRREPGLSLVWTGPESRASTARSTALVVEELFIGARQSVMVGGYSFDEPEILEPLFTGMRDRGLRVQLFLDIPGEATTRDGSDAFATAFIDRFFRDVWTFGHPRPDVFYDPRTAMPGPPWASLHAKCVVVDDERALITSANFTDRGQTRNIEAGVLIDDEPFASQLAAQWRQLVSEGLVKPYRG